MGRVVRVVRFLVRGVVVLGVVCFTTFFAVNARPDEVGLAAGLGFGLVFGILFVLIDFGKLAHDDAREHRDRPADRYDGPTR